MSKHKKPTKKKVSIIIPFYGQTENDLSIPLASINNQIGVDFAAIDVHLVNDGGAPIDIAKFDIFENLDLHYHELPENVGPGLARQYGIDNSEGEYLMFVDSDDTLNILDALAGFFMAVEQLGEHSMIVSPYLIQIKDLETKNRFTYRSYAPNTTASNVVVYGKWFRRAYLKQIGLHFSPELTIYYEDAYFVGLAMLFTSDAIETNQTSYLRRYNDNSITHADDYRRAKPQDVFVKMCRLQLEKINELKPEILVSRIEVILVSSFLGYKMYKMPDETKYWQELHQLLTEFPYDVRANFSKLEMMATSADIKSQESYYKDMDTSGLKEFLDKIEKVSKP